MGDWSESDEIKEAKEEATEKSARNQGVERHKADGPRFD